MAAANEFMHHLSMACCEWILMVLMHIDAALGYIVIKFAHHCELQTPCLFCWKFNHVFGTENLRILCNNHRFEVSSLISCDLHDKLADVHEMCDDCFMSVINQKDESKLGFQKPYLNKHLIRAPSSSTGLCSCCKKQWKPKPKRTKPPVPRVTGPVRARGRCHRRNDFKRVREMISGNSTPYNSDSDALSDSGCTDISDFDDSFYEVECGENGGPNGDVWVINDKNKPNKYQIRPDRIVSNPESSLLNGPCNMPITGLKSLTSNGPVGPIGHDVKDNGPHNETLTGREHVTSSNGSTVNTPLKRIITGRESLSSNGSNGPHNITTGNESLSSNGSIGPESPESGHVTETEGETDIEKLKRQVARERNRLRLLSKELDEERNASAIAADEAMAMITRLQEEKAALHMEASQYLRMMDEQAEYDMEALDKANDIITERDKEIQDLEDELEYFRSRYEDELFNGNSVKIDNFKKNIIHHMILELEDEKDYVLKSLSDLESKFDQNDLSERDEVSDLNRRLEAVEADQEFLEHACNTLHSYGGLAFVQEIGRRLRKNG